MRLPAATIWDIKIQCVCSIVTAREGTDVELWMCGNFGQASLDPPRIVINPNRLYPIEAAMRRERRFAINVAPASARDAVIRASRMRRRGPNKARVVGLPLREDGQHGIPYLEGCLRTLFCEVEQVLDTGDHRVMIARVLESRVNPAHEGERPLLYPEVSGTPSKWPALSKVVRTAITATGLKDAVRGLMSRHRGAPPAPDLPANTYRQGGQTEEEIREILRHGVRDEGRMIAPPERPPAALARKVGVCVAGTGQWGSFHCNLFHKADPNVELYVCGRDANRAARLARACGARDYIVGLEKAAEDPRIEALALILPHHLHAWGVGLAAAAGKHALVEKPIATTLEESDAMIEAAHRAGVILMVAEDVHFRPAIREAVAAIARGDIGEPLYFKAHAGGLLRPEGWKADARLMGGGVLMDIGVHYARAVRLVMGEPDRVLATRAQQVNTKISGDDSVQVLFSSQLGWQAHMLLSWAGPRGHSPDVIVLGEGGVLHLWPGAGYVDLYPATPLPAVQLLSHVRPAWLAEKLILPRIERVRLPLAGEDQRGYLTEVREFLAAVAEGRQPATVPRDARRDLEIVLRAYEALREQTWVGVGSPSVTPSSRGGGPDGSCCL